MPAPLRALSLFATLGLVGGAATAALDDDRFLLARAAFQSGDITRLDELAGGLREHVLYPYVAYWQLRSHLDDTPAAEVQKLIARYPNTLVAQRLRVDWLKLLGRRQQWEEFARGFPQAGVDDPELACYALRARLAQGGAEALKEGRALWFAPAAQPDACAPLFDAMLDQQELTYDDLWLRVRLALEAGNVSFAKQLLTLFPAGQRPDARALDAIVRNPQAWLDRKPSGFSSRSQREYTMFALYRTALNWPQVAVRRWEKIAAQFPQQDRGYMWAQLAYAGATQHEPQALQWYRQAGSTPLNDRQAAWKVRAALRAANWAMAAAAVEDLSPRDRQHPAWRYWHGRALAAIGRQGDAFAILAPLSSEPGFYGQLAAEELGAALGSVSESYRPGAEELAATEQLPGIQRALALYRLGLRYEGALEWQWTIKDFSDERLVAAAHVANRNGWYERAIDTAEKTRTVHDFALRYPLPYRDLVRLQTDRLRIDEAWVYGLVRQESRFVVDARSSAGASGLMQLMPGTASMVARRIGMKDYHRSQITAVETNMSLGTHHLRELLDLLDDNELLASAAYNAGLSRARDWRATHGLEGAVYAETIPFGETRDYVRKVMSNTMHYARLLGHQLVSLKRRLGAVGPREMTSNQ